MALSYKRQAFVNHYLANGFNATKAAEAAGYAAPRQAGSRLLSSVDIQAEIAARTASLAMSADEALQRLAARARVSIADFYDVDDAGNLVLNLQRARESGKLDLIDNITYDRQGNLILKLPDRIRALELIGRNLGLWVDRVQQDTTMRFDMMTDDELREYILSNALDSEAEPSEAGPTAKRL